MPSPLLVVEIARVLPAWNPQGGREELEAVVRNVRASLVVLVAGERGANVARAAFEHRKADPQDPEKRPEFDGLSARERSDLAQLCAHVQTEAVARGIVTAVGGAAVKELRRAD